MPNEILDRFRAKYPQYAQSDDTTLAKGIISKYPQYKDALADVFTPQQQAPQTPSNPSMRGAAGNVFAQPQQELQKASNYFQQGNVGAGIGAGGNAGLSAGMEATGIPTGLRALSGMGGLGQFASEGLQGLMGLPGQIATGASSLIGSGLRALGVPENVMRMGLNPEADKELSSLLTNAGVLALTPQLAKGAEGVAQGIGKAGTGMENLASKIAGKSFGAGENFQRTQQLGKFAQEHGITMGKSGLDATRGLADQLNNEIQTKIIQPATQAGKLINGNDYVKAMEDFKGQLSDRAVPDKASIAAVDRMIDSAKDRLKNSASPGFIDPTTAQRMKVENNQILSDTYKKMEAGGNLDERTVAKKVALIKQTDVLRRQLEELHPQLRELNWHEGQALQLNNAIYDFLNKKARGEGGMDIVARGGIGRAMTFSIYDLLKLRPIASKVAVVLGKTGRAITGNQPNIVTGVK